ncbi:MAG: hypothetical protein Q4F41_01800 [Eubacteriales bacterium]|nr:hypothetical protein [Eubacteriales bacterium]
MNRSPRNLRKSGVGEETRKRILEEVERCHYQIDEAASVLKRRERRVLVVRPKAVNEERFYFRGLWREIRRAAEDMAQYRLSFTYLESEYPLSEMWKELERIYDEQIEEIDGMITADDGEKASIWLSRFTKRGDSGGTAVQLFCR